MLNWVGNDKSLSGLMLGGPFGARAGRQTFLSPVPRNRDHAGSDTLVGQRTDAHARLEALGEAGGVRIGLRCGHLRGDAVTASGNHVDPIAILDAELERVE